MLSAPTKLIARLLMAMQVLMTLDIATKEQTKMLSVALPITSKPIESTAENLAWEAWLMLPPEQKNQIKSRKVTPKSIFSLPQRKPCQQGHHKVDTKCIPIINGSNALLIDPSVLILVVGDTGEALEFDYDLIEEEEEEEEEEERTSSTSQKLVDSRQGLDKPTTDAIEQKLTKQDEPLKFNIFQSKFPTDYDINDDYLNLSNEAVASTTIETTEDQFGSTTDTLRNRSILRTGIDLRSEASNISETQTSVVIPFNSTPLNNDSLALSTENLEQEKPVNETFIEDDSSVHLITGDETSAPSRKMHDQYSQQKDDIVDDDITQIDIVEMLKKEAFMPLLNNTQISSESHPTIIAHVENNLNSSLTTEQVNVSKDGFSLNLDVEEITTLPSIFVESDADIGGKYRKKTDCIRSVSTKTTNFESSSVDMATTTSKGDKKEFMPGQLKDPYNGLKKSKVEPVELMPAQATTATTTMEDLITAETATETEISSAETVTPLLTIRNENNNDRFYYENFTKQDLKTTLTTMMTTKQGSNSSSDETIIEATTPMNTVTSTLRTASEIDLTKELHLVNELVKGNQQQQNFTLTEQNKTSKTTTKTTTTRTATIKSTAEITTWDKIALFSSTSSTIVDDSSKQQTDITKSSLSTTTSTITPEWQGIKAPSNVETQKNFEELAFPNNAQRIESESLIDISDLRTDYLSAEASSLPTPTVKISENRSHRNSKIIRTKTFKTFISTVRPTLATKLAAAVAAAATETATTATTNDNNNNNILEPYWWPPIPWYVDKSTTSKQTENQAKTNTVESNEKEEDEPLLLRFWSTYHSPNRFKN